jgi:hypothetical protein
VYACAARMAAGQATRFYLVDQTGSFVLALAIDAAVMMAGAAVYQFMVVDPITEADLAPASRSRVLRQADASVLACCPRIPARPASEEAP